MDRRINQKLKHFDAAIGSSKSDNKTYIEWVIKKLGSLNKQITRTNFMQLYCPDLIGSTALHLAYSKEDLEPFRMLITLGIDCTVKNEKGLTALHLVVESVNKILHSHSKWVGTLKDPFITAILAAHIEYKEAANPCDANGFSHFHAACMTNNIGAVEFFLDNGVSIHDGVNVNSNYYPGYTPLHFAVRHFSLQVVEVLLSRGSSIHSRDAKGMTPLQILLERNFEMVSFIDSHSKSSIIKQERNLSDKIARLLLFRAAEIDSVMIDETGLFYLHVASALMDLSEVEKLLEKVTHINHCVNVESPLWAGYTALHFAAFFNVNIVKLLVRREADLQAKDAKGVTPLDLCLERYKVEEIHSILSQKKEWKDIMFSDKKTRLLDLISVMKSCDHLKKFLRRVSRNTMITLPNDSLLWPGFTPMHLAVILAKSIANLHKKQHQVAEESYLQMISSLFDKNSKMIEIQDIHGRTPLHLCFCSKKMKSIIDFLLTLHQKLDHPHDFVDEDNLSLLHIACAYSNQNLVAKFLSHSNNSNLVYAGESIKKAIIRGWTPLHVAVIQRQSSGSSIKEQNSNIVKMLLKHGADVNAKDTHEITPIHMLAIPSYYGKYNENNSVDDMLLSSPDMKEVASTFGLTHLHIACFLNKGDVVKKLVDEGADVNCAIKKIPKMYDQFVKGYSSWDSTEYLNNTPLHILLKSSRGNKKTIEFLIRGGADIFAKNSEGVPLLYEILGALDEDEDPDDSNLDNLKILLEALGEYENFRIRAEKDIGLTQLHIACRTNDTSLIESLLDSGADLNAQISLDSPIWPGYTSLHILIDYANKYEDDENTKSSISLLLYRRADVTLSDSNQRTPIHLAYRYYIKTQSTGSNDSTFARPYILFRAQRDFSINPTSIEGITHFHIACSLADVFIIKKFLKHEHIDVDQPIDFFQDLDDAWKGFRAAGCTPLHLAVMKRYRGCGHTKYVVDITSSFETVDLLLKRGADVDVENAWGDTPFHIAACNEFRQRLVRSGANVNIKNAIGYTPLEDSLIYRSKSLDELKNLFLCGCHYNAFNFGTEIGFIGLTMRLLPLEKMQKLVSVVIMNYPSLMVDEMGRTELHNLVSIYQINASSDDYLEMIEHFARTGCDVDAQDKWGRTALHVAVKFKNLRAISGLLLAGVDINITDVNGQTAFAHQFEPCTRCDQPTDAEDEQCEHYRIYKFLALQVKKLHLCGLDVHPMNEEIVAEAFSSFNNVNVNDQFVNEWEEMNYLKFKSCLFTLHDFMSELNVVAYYPNMSESKRDIVDEFFHPYEGFRSFREKYREIAGLLRLQYRKAVKRTEFLQKAKISLDLLADIRIPDLCSRIILRFLKNSELQNMITASEDTNIR